MGAIWTVFRKEVLENLRDRRVILSAFFFGVLLAPVIFGLTTTMVSKRAVENQDKPLDLPIAGAAHALFVLATGLVIGGMVWLLLREAKRQNRLRGDRSRRDQ